MLYVFLLIGAIAINTLLIYILLWRKVLFTSNIIFIVFLLLINLWAIPQIVINIFQLSAFYFSLFNKISAAGYVFIPVTYFIFVLSVTNRLYVLRNWNVPIFLFFSSFIFLFLSWATDLVVIHRLESVVVREWGLTSSQGSLFWLFLLWFEVIMIKSILILIQAYREVSAGVRRKQLFFLIISIVVPLSAGSITNGILPLFSIHIFPTAVPLTTVMGMVVVFAVVRYGLFEASPWHVMPGISGGVIGVDTQGRVVHVSDYAQYLIGSVKRDVLGRTIGSVLHIRDSSKKPLHRNNNPFFQSIQKEKRIVSKDYYLAFKGKRHVPIDLTVEPLFSDGGMWGATIFFRDISIEKRLEQNKDDFLSMASHELKTPIATLKLYSQMLQRKVLRGRIDSAQGEIQKILLQIGRLEHIVTDFGDIGRIQSGKMGYEKEYIDLNKVVGEAVSDMKRLSAHKIKFSGNFSKHIYADEKRIYQVLSNLISNAMKYSPEGERIIVGIEEDDFVVRVSIQDFGAGIPKQEMKSIFDKFYRTKNGMEAPGLGMGLYIASNIVTDHGGKIKVESKKGEGSTFLIELPVENDFQARS